MFKKHSTVGVFVDYQQFLDMLMVIFTQSKQSGGNNKLDVLRDIYRQFKCLPIEENERSLTRIRNIIMKNNNGSRTIENCYLKQVRMVHQSKNN